ncbi:Sybindin-like family protein [Trichinella nativa]|uniref:Trafficking protein particle complex subunit n=1 Tax=Trichinella nativa TaxID=6335 RepID=A0A1Y3EBV1_9BILA|nr:Sybindin-like family protein [Trichinella nativa]
MSIAAVITELNALKHKNKRKQIAYLTLTYGKHDAVDQLVKLNFWQVMSVQLCTKQYISCRKNLKLSTNEKMLLRHRTSTRWRMTIHCLYIFDRHGKCISYIEWKRYKQLSMNRIEEFQLVNGLISSIKSFVNKLSPISTRCVFKSFCTDSYKLTYFETPTSLKFVINTDIHAKNVHNLLQTIFSEVYVPYVTKNPSSIKNNKICSELFSTKLDELVQAHECFD